MNGALSGTAGVCLSMAQGNGFLRDMSAGRGRLALAALIFGKWRLWPVLGTCLLSPLPPWFRRVCRGERCQGSVACRCSLSKRSPI